MKIRRGPALMVLASAAFTVMLVLVKLARQDMSAFDVIFWRGLVAVPIAAILAWPVGYRVVNKRLLLLRCGLGFVAMVGFFTSTWGLPVTDTSLISKLQPVVIALLAPVFLGRGERSERSTWLLLVVGLVGAAVLLSPDLSWWTEEGAAAWRLRLTYGGWALLGTVGSGCAHVCLRGLGRTDHPTTLVLWFQVAIVLLSFTALVARTGHLPELPVGANLAYVVGVGVFAVVGQVAMTSAYKADRASLVAVASYTSPVFAVAADVLVWSALPSANAYIGGAIVLGAGVLLVFWRERPPVL